MNLASLLPLGDGIISPQRLDNPFRWAQADSLPFLVTVKPVNLAPLRPLLDASGMDDQPGRPPRRSGRIEAIVLKLVGGLFLLVITGCGFGAQRIAYLRAESRIARELRQTELNLRVATLACRSLEVERSLLLAQGTPLSAPQLAKADTIQPAVVAKASGPAVARNRKPAPVPTSGAAFSRAHALVGDTGHPVRRNRIRG